MQAKPLISILIVAYNPWEYLKNTLRSCIEQSYENTEILILDNASSEDISKSITELQDYRITERKEQSNVTSFTLCETVKLWNCKTVKLYRNETNLWPYNWLNLLLEEAQWEYIAIQDHDDIWHPEKLMKQMDFLQANPEYIGCGTKTIMYYEWDKKYFEYSLWEKNYYTIHPSLVFRKTNHEKRITKNAFRYDTSETEYMCDAWSLKNNLCHGEKLIYNLEESLTLHLIKKWSTNYSYRWHKLSWINIKRVYSLHSPLYATLTLGWEIKRKVVYPLLQAFWLGRWIDAIERMPFRLFGNQIKTTQRNEWWKEYID